MYKRASSVSSHKITPASGGGIISCAPEGNGGAGPVPRMPVPSFVSSGIESTRGAGNSLPDTTRSFMEDRFGADFSSVRVHQDGEAAKLSESLNAQAFTVGKDIYFNQGKYSPESSEGKQLLAHELTHTMQQESGEKQGIQRKVKVNDGVNLDTKGFAVAKSGNSYSCPAVVKNLSVLIEIFTSMLHSEVTFKLAGDTDAAANENLQKHMAARLGIIEFANREKHYDFGAGLVDGPDGRKKFAMNQKFWIVDEHGFRPKPGVDRQEAIEDLTKTHDGDPLYDISCEAATNLTMEGGSKSKPVPEASLNTDDWVPGDAGFVKNKTFDRDKDRRGLEGENIIYLGKDIFWGHTGPSLERKTLQAWMDEVKSFLPNAEPEVANERSMPNNGLE